jgi:hypothetical protein
MGVVGADKPGLGESKCDGRSLGGGFVKNIVI